MDAGLERTLELRRMPVGITPPLPTRLSPFLGQAGGREAGASLAVHSREEPGNEWKSFLRRLDLEFTLCPRGR